MLAHSSGREVDQNLEPNKSKYNGVGMGTTPNKFLTNVFYFDLFEFDGGFFLVASV